MILKSTNTLEGSRAHVTRLLVLQVWKQELSVHMINVISKYGKQLRQARQVQFTTRKAIWALRFENSCSESTRQLQTFHISCLECNHSICPPTKKLHNCEHNNIAQNAHRQVRYSLVLHPNQPVMRGDRPPLLLGRGHVSNPPHLRTHHHRELPILIKYAHNPFNA